MTNKDKIIIAIAVVAGLALLIVDGVAGSKNCSGRYDQTTAVCVEDK